MTTTERIKMIIDEYNGEDNAVTDETDIRTDLAVTSLAFFQLLNEIEDEFDIEIRDKDIALFHTVGDLLRYIEEKGGR